MSRFKSPIRTKISSSAALARPLGRAKGRRLRMRSQGARSGTVSLGARPKSSRRNRSCKLGQQIPRSDSMPPKAPISSMRKELANGMEQRLIFFGIERGVTAFRHGHQSLPSAKFLQPLVQDWPLALGQLIRRNPLVPLLLSTPAKTHQASQKRYFRSIMPSVGEFFNVIASRLRPH